MSKVNNVVKKIKFENEDGLFWGIHDYLETLNAGDEHLYHVQALQLLNKNEAIVVCEEVIDAIRVKFVAQYPDQEGGVVSEDIVFDESSQDKEIMSFQELNLLLQIKNITLNDEHYFVKEIQYCIEADGSKLAEIIVEQ